MSDWRNPDKRQARIVRYEDGTLRAMTGTIEEVHERGQDWVEKHGPIAAIA